MTWGEIQIEALKKMFLNKENLDIEELQEYKQDKKYKTYLFSMKQACNEALVQIYSVMEPNIGVYNLINTDTNIYDLSSLIEDYETLYDIEAPTNVNWSMKTNNLLKIANWHNGELTIYYEKKHVFINDNTLDDKKIDISEKYAKLIPLYIAGELYKDDDLTIATMYLNEFNNTLSMLANKRSYINNNKISPIYRME